MPEISAAPASAAPPSLKERFLSLDFFRGLTMFLLIGESTLLYEHLRDPRPGGTILGVDRHPARPSPLGRAALLGPRPAVLHVHRRRGPGLFRGQARGAGGEPGGDHQARRRPRRHAARPRLGALLHRAGPHHLPLPERPGPARRDLSHRLFPDEAEAADADRLELRLHPGDRGHLPDLLGRRATTSPSSRTTTSARGWTCSSGASSRPATGSPSTPSRRPPIRSGASWPGNG